MFIPYRIRLWVSEQWTLSPGYRGVCLSVCLSVCIYVNSLQNTTVDVRTVDTVTRLQGSVSVRLSVFMLIPYRIRLWVSEQWTLSPGYRGVCLSVCLSVFMLIPYRIRLWVSEQWTLSPGYRGVCLSVCLSVCIYVNSLQNTTVGVRTVDIVTRLQGSLSVCLSVFMLIPYRIRLWLSEQWTLSPGYRGVCLSVCIYVHSLQNTTAGVRTVDTVTRLQGSVSVCLSVRLYLCSFLTEYDCGCQNSGHCHQVTGECVCLSVCLSVCIYLHSLQNTTVAVRTVDSHQVTGECVCLSVCIYVHSLQNTTVGVRTVDTVTRLQGSVSVRLYLC